MARLARMVRVLVGTAWVEMAAECPVRRERVGYARKVSAPTESITTIAEALGLLKREEVGKPVRSASM